MAREGDNQSEAEALSAPKPIYQWLTGFFRRRVRDQAIVDDLVQDVFVRIAGRRSTEKIDNLGAYVLRTAISVLADQGRKWTAKSAFAEVSFDPNQHGGEEIDPERVFAGKQELTRATAALLSLPERTRTVFVLRRIDQLPMREIAQQLGISVSAVEKHMIRGLRHLTHELERDRDS